MYLCAFCWYYYDYDYYYYYYTLSYYLCRETGEKRGTLGQVMLVFLEVMPCSMVDGCQCFAATCCFHLQGSI
jgi:hypothetical protein